jgi:hypothetical protein
MSHHSVIQRRGLAAGNHEAIGRDPINTSIEDVREPRTKSCGSIAMKLSIVR